MKLKCIGGECHEQKTEVPDNLRTGDAIQVRIKQEFKVLDYLPTIDEIPALVAQKLAIYKIERLKYVDKKYGAREVKFLVPVDCKDVWGAVCNYLEC